MATHILCIVGPTASGKSALAVEIALKGFGNPSSGEGFPKPFIGEIISVDSRQVYRGLDIGTEKITTEEMCGVPHHLIDIHDVNEIYSAGDFVTDAARLIEDISKRGKLPILVGGTHFYFDALLRPIPEIDVNPAFRAELEKLSTEELSTRVRSADARRASELDPQNRRRLIRALEIIDTKGKVPVRPSFGSESRYCSKWIVIDPPKEELRARIDARLASAFDRGLIEEVRTIREKYGDERINELGLEYKIIGEFLNKNKVSNTECLTLLLHTLSAKLWQYARRQKAWLRKLNLVTSSHQDRS
ncbi:MAG: tRNA (adenosine(37)-N6)-dimethylallyltransferase MiaA [Candidatus Kaiserbacteria bacterium]|nr:tRNA (adenosine(37)-N6)-dimethylallyltransferase MiaA [Candidatus Kaiserbacteria bacterium]